MPRDLLAAVRVALQREDGSDAFSGYRTVTARRLDAVTGRSSTNNHTGYAHTVSDLSGVYPGSNIWGPYVISDARAYEPDSPTVIIVNYG